MMKTDRRDRMAEVLHMLMKSDEEFKKEFIKDMTEEEYNDFIKECPEFLEEQ